MDDISHEVRELIPDADLTESPKSLSILRGEIEALLRATYEYRAERDVLREVARATSFRTNGNLDPRDFVSNAAKTIEHMPRVELGFVMLFEKDGESPVIVETVRVDDGDRCAFLGRASTGILERVRRSGEAVYSEDAIEDGEFAEMASVREQQMRTVFCCPISGLSGAPPRGAVYVENRSLSDAFPRAWRQAVQLLADQIAYQHAFLDAADPGPEEDSTVQYRRLGRFEEVVGCSECTALMLRSLDRIVSSKNPPSVLLVGETGVGKDLAAQALHRNGPRKNKPYVPVNVASLQATTAEAELFGTTRGAFTDATNRTGLFHEADGGILFLDEIGEVSHEIQRALLRVLDDHRVRRVGSTNSEKVDVWIIAAMSSDPQEAMDIGCLKPELYYRLRGVEVAIPPLRERREDIEPLAQHFAIEAAMQEGTPRPVLSPDLVVALQTRSWAGNVRELRNTIHRLVRNTPHHVLTADHLRAGYENSLDEDSEEELSWRSASHRFQETYFRWAFARWGPSVTRVSERLGIHKTYVRRLCKEFGIPVGGAIRVRA